LSFKVRWIFKFISVIIALGLILSALIVGAVVYFNAPPEKPVALLESTAEARQNRSSPPDESMRFEEDSLLYLEVKSGETAISMGRRLENAGVIKSRYFWNLLFRLDNEQIKTGTYRIELPASQVKIRSILTGGEQILVRVTIPEGITLKKMSLILEESGICKADNFLEAASSSEILDTYSVPGPSMEGYLFPDTYFFPLGFPAQRVVSMMADTFFYKLKEIIKSDMSSEELNTRVIIASIVEREYSIPEEAPNMAGVFFNRLRIGMALQSCATVAYVITEIQGRPHPEVLLTRDLEIRDPYNTYLRAGLPPGPISAPGAIALKAAFNPAKSDYLYFRLTDPSTGQHYFSKTLDDHIRAGTLYLKRR